MPKGPLRRSIEDAAATFGSDEGDETWWEKVKRRFTEYETLLDKIRKENPFLVFFKGNLWIGFGLYYALTGSTTVLNLLQEFDQEGLQIDASKHFADIMQGMFDNPAVGELVESLGAVITEPVITLFEQYAAQDDPDPHEFARSFHGFMISLNISAGLADTVAESVSGGQVEGLGRMIESMYWSLGLGFLGWQTLAPLLGSGLQPPLERHYQKLYRPERFSASDLRDLYALGEISKEDLSEGARTSGWREEDIQQWIKLAFRVLNQGQIFDAYHQDLIDETEAVKRLRVLGYDPQDIPLLFQLNPKDDIDDLRSFTAGTARAAYRENLISADELRAILTTLKYRPEEIDLIIGIEDARRTTDTKSLTLGQIKSAWEENVLGDTEARHWLELADFGPDEIAIILDTWKIEVVPEFRKINVGTITGAYIEGILTRQTAASRLREVGFGQEDAALELDLVEARNPEAFGKPIPPPAKLLTPGTLSQLVTVALITPLQMVARLLTLGYSQDDAELLGEAARIRALPIEFPLSQLSIERAYLAGVIDRVLALEQLIKIGLSVEDSDQVLDTVEAENPETFGAEPEIRIRALSASTLEDLFLSGLITQENFRARLLQIGASETDADLLVERALLRAEPSPRLFTQSTVERGYLADIFDRALALEFLTALDYTPEKAEQVIQIVEAENPEAFGEEPEERNKYLTAGTLEDLLIGGLITADEMTERLLLLGLSQEDAELLTARAVQFTRPAVRILSREDVTRAYLIAVIDRTTALNKLIAMDFTVEDAEQIIATVEAENPQIFDPSLLQSTRLPSIEALTAAVKNGIITEDEYFIRAQELGFLAQDAAMYLTIATRNERKSTKRLSASQLGQAYDAGFLSRGIALSRLNQQGYDNEDAIMLLRIRKDFIENTDIWNQLIAGNIDAFSAIAQLVNAHYSDEDIVEAFGALPPVTLAAMDISIVALSEALGETPGGE